MAPRWSLHPFAPLLIYSVVFSALLVAYVLAGFAPSPAFESFASFCWMLLLALAVVADARRRKQIPCFDFGMFCFFLWPVVVPWYCLWSRGLQGLFVLAALFALWVGPYFIAAIVWLMTLRPA